MKPTKKTYTLAFFSTVVLISLSVLLLLTGCPTKPGGVTLAMSGTVLEEFGGPPVTTHSGDNVLFLSGTKYGPATATTAADGSFSNPKAVWDGNSFIGYSAYNNTAVDGIIFNKLGNSPYNDLQLDTFLLTTPGTTVPVIVIAQDFTRSPHTSATIQILDASNNVVTSGTTGTNGATPAFNLNFNTTYQVAATGLTNFTFTTKPIEGSTGTPCRLRIYARY